MQLLMLIICDTNAGIGSIFQTDGWQTTEEQPTEGGLMAEGQTDLEAEIVVQIVRPPMELYQN